ncbi:MAG: ATP-binding protein [Planctomycetota bacterium]
MTKQTEDERTSHTTSFRLILGFGTVLAIFGMALLINIYNLEQLKTATEAVRVRQQIRRRTLNVVQAANRMNRRLGSGLTVKAETLEEFNTNTSQMTHALQTLATTHIDALEWTALNDLTLTAKRLHRFLSNTAGQSGDAGAADRRSVSHRLTTKMSDLNSRVGDYFDAKTYDLEARANWSWQVSIIVTRSMLAVALIVSLLVVYITHRAIMRPIKKLLAGTRALAEGDLDSRIEEPKRGEFRMLARSFNRMARALQDHQKQLVEAEKLATLGRFAAGTAHEINNPITVILGYAKTVKNRLKEDSPHREALQSIVNEARQCRGIVRELLEMSRPAPRTENNVYSPAELVNDVLNLTEVLEMTDQTDIHTDVPDREISLTISRSRLRQVILNLITNALEAMKDQENRKLEISGFIRDEDTSGTQITRELVLVVKDNGPGIPEEEADKIFEPFFTTKSTGTGLGLTMAYSIVDGHGGEIQLNSNREEGTNFTLRLPVRNEEYPGRERTNYSRRQGASEAGQ